MSEQFKLDDRVIKKVGWSSEPDFFSVEIGRDRVTKINCVEQFLGEYSIVWMQVWKDNIISARYNARNVDTIEYFVDSDFIEENNE